MKIYSTLFAGLAITVAFFVGVASLSAQSETAVYNSTLKAPECATVGSSCDSGPSLLLGRDTMSGGAEPNQPYAFGQRHSSFCHRPVVKWKDGFQQSCYGVA